MKLSLIHPSRSRPQKSKEAISKWGKAFMGCDGPFELIVSVDTDDFNLNAYVQLYGDRVLISNNKSAVDAINNAAKVASGDILMVVSDDTEPHEQWNFKILDEVKDKRDWILKTQDGIQPWIITMPVMDRAYYNRTGYIYDPDFDHMFCDTWLTVQADISGRKINSNLLFPHLNDSIKDEVRVKSDATWNQGERTFIQKVNNTPIEDLKKITDVSMKNWIKNKTGIRL